MAIRSRVYEILDVANPGDRVSRIVDLGILSLIVLNVTALIFESMPEYRDRYHPFFTSFEQVSLILFTVEYVLRICSCPASPPGRG